MSAHPPVAGAFQAAGPTTCGACESLDTENRFDGETMWLHCCACGSDTADAAIMRVNAELAHRGKRLSDVTIERDEFRHAAKINANSAARFADLLAKAESDLRAMGKPRAFLLGYVDAVIAERDAASEYAERRFEAGMKAAREALLPLGAGDFVHANDHDAGFMRGVETCILKIDEMVEALPVAVDIPLTVARPICWLRTLDGKPDWEEDCVSSDEHSLRSTLPAAHGEEPDGYDVIPLYAHPAPEETKHG